MIQECDDLIRREEQAIEWYATVIPKMKPIEAAIRIQADAIAELERSRPDFVRRMLQPDKARAYHAKLGELKDRLQFLYSQMQEATSGTGTPILTVAEKDKEAAGHRLESRRKWRDQLRTILEEKKRVRAIREAKEAKAAAFDGKARERASVIKRQLELYPYCPYCGGSIGDVPHADHIYPVALGGLSTRENMVHICEDCNKKKGTKTLREFIKIYQLDRTRIEAILNRLNKKF